MTDMFKNLNIDLVKKYDVGCPYYTSYPTLSEWSNNFSYDGYLTGLQDLCYRGKEFPLLLYIHFPFCEKQCYYCICNSVITHDRAKIQNFMQYLFREIELLHDFFGRHSFIPKFKRIHLGGGSPSFMNIEEFDLLIEKLKLIINMDDLDEFAMEVDFHTTNKEKLRHYAAKGVNRISLGIQDFDPDVQKAVNRVQPPELVQDLLSPETRGLFKGINFDLLYGLPLQNRASFRQTIEIVKEISPDRITFLKYAHVPDRAKHQRLIKESDLPDVCEREMIFIDSIDSLLEEGYEYLGIDHFAKPTDDLVKAVSNGTMWRNFNGFASGGLHYIIGIGPTSTSGFMNYYAQNVYTFSDYYKAIDNQRFPVLRGFKLNTDDLIRRDIINGILCTYTLNFKDIERKYNIDFNAYFSKEMGGLSDLIYDGIIEISNEMLTVTQLGRIFIRHVCKVFDRYFKDKVYKISGP